MKINIPIEQFLITDISSTSGRRALLAGEIVISSAIAVVNADPVAIQANLNTAISSGAFTQALVADGFTTAAASTVASLVDTTSSSPTAAPTSEPNEKKAFPTGSAVGIAIGCFAAICIMCGSVYFFFCRKKEESGNVNSDKGEDFGRGSYLEEHNSPNVVRQRDVAEGVKRSDNNL